MKKAFVAIAAGVLAAAMCAGFAACGGGNPDPEKVKSKKIESAEEWTAAFDFSEVTEYKLVYTNEMTVTSGEDSASLTQTGTYILTPTAAKMTVETKIAGNKELLPGYLQDEASNEEEYYEFGETPKHYYKNDADEWVWEEDDDAPSMIEVFTMYAGMYEAYEYSEEHSGYVSKSGGVSGEEPIIKFGKDGKVCAIYMEQTEEEGENKSTTKASYTIVYGKQSVKLPTAKPANPTE